MDVDDLEQLEDRLDAYLARFGDCFGRSDTRAHLTTYVRGQLSDLDAKSVEPIALQAGTPVRTLQEFLAQHRWNEDALRRRLIHIVRDEHVTANTVAIIDETSDVKKGDKTPGVQRQWCGKVGKQENCIVTVHLAAATEDFHCMVDGELFLPESWSNDRQRCAAAGIPDEMVYRPKWQIALELLDRSEGEGIVFPWLTADEGYGGKPGFLEGLASRDQKFVLEVPRTFSVWEKPPEVTEQPYRKGGRGRGRKTPRIKSGESLPRSVETVFWHGEAMKAKRWKRYRVKDGEKGPIIWEAKRVRVTLKGSDGLPGMSLWLVVARNVLDGELKFFVSNASQFTSMAMLLQVAFQRWRVERCFEDQKQEVGLDCYEGRRYLGLKRHLIITSLSYLFLSQTCQQAWEKKYGVDDSANSRRGRRDRCQLVASSRESSHLA
ncbi:IS701 family transposase [Rhodopirellula bahusiensis]|uniref:IS701 family transposase n=1 Tax=Rhodopirellula bahusiensis TaxID=2014065 RepID=UPI0032630B64